MRRKNRFETYKEAASRNSYDEFPMLELGIDPQLHLSRNLVPQPFFLICEQDTVLAQMSGAARIEFRDSPVIYMTLALGDFVYVPGGVSVGPTTHPVGQKPDQPASPDMFYIGVITQRQSVGMPQHEAMIFHCEKCGSEIFRREYGAHEMPDRLDGPVDPQILGLPTISQSSAAAEAFNREEAARTCGDCGHHNAPFPSAYWGWDHYRRRTAVAVAARKIMADIAAGA